MVGYQKRPLPTLRSLSTLRGGVALVPRKLGRPPLHLTLEARRVAQRLYQARFVAKRVSLIATSQRLLLERAVALTAASPPAAPVQGAPPPRSLAAWSRGASAAERRHCTSKQASEGSLQDYRNERATQAE